MKARAARAKPAKMLGGICPCCMTWHDPPACGWDSEKPCPECGRPIGLRSWALDGSRCARCAFNLPDAAAPPPPPRQPPEWWEAAAEAATCDLDQLERWAGESPGAAGVGTVMTGDSLHIAVAAPLTREPAPLRP